MRKRTADTRYEGKAPKRLAGILSFTRWVVVPIARWGGAPRFVSLA